ncbi:hypothetical protein OIU74_021365 [Salix koriyanagi]|uniref:Pentatricopeptide repeat-containing protein n=1 Tax=Salix koriyanagi TaxID=2511006 RepID=A0A9Q1ADI7_9ROSI|nr:hypothetical protein OIU74_021365 [Salix koriyanagi]
MLAEGKRANIPANANDLTRTSSTCTITSSRALQQRLFSLLQRKQQPALEHLAQIHAQILINGFSRTKNFLLAPLLSFYSYSSAHSVFKDIQSPSTILWNQMIRAHARSQSPANSIQFFNQMLLTDARPDAYTYSFLLAACTSSLSLRAGQQVHSKVLTTGYYSSNVFLMSKLVNFYAAAVGGDCDALAYARKVFDDMSERNVVSWNSMLAGYMRRRNLDGARRIFDEMPERNVVSWTTMISGYAKNGKCKQALNLFGQMRKAGVGLDRVVLLAALTACAELGDLRMGMWIHSYIRETFDGSSQRVFVSLNNALIHMYASCGMIDEAYEVFRWMPERSAVSWTSLIAAFAKQGYAHAVLEIFRSMQGTSEARPDDITFIWVLCACSHAGLVDEGRQFFEDMIRRWGIKPRIEHYGCMVDLLSRAGFLDEARELIETMPIKPNNAVWGALLGGCRFYRNAELASHVSQNLVAEPDPDKAAGYLSLLAHVYATAEKWQDAAAVRQKMAAMGVKKPGGQSWVQINEVVHDFVAGDRTHKNTSSIYEMLGKSHQASKDRDTCDHYLQTII